jgi:hypothetical protein
MPRTKAQTRRDQQTGPAMRPESAYGRRVVETDLPLGVPGGGSVLIEQEEDGTMVVTLGAGQIADTFTGTLHVNDSVGFEFDDLAVLEGFGHALLAAAAKARAVGIGAKICNSAA